MKITSFEDALRRLDDAESCIQDLRKFLDTAMNAMAAVSSLRGTGSMEVNRAPASWTDRVAAIYKLAGKPLMQKEVTAKYRELQWPDFDADDLYTKISGAIAYLHSNKGVLTKTEAGYVIKE